MALEAFIWCWINLHPYFVLRRLAYLLGLAAILLIPLIYINADMVRQGYQLMTPRAEMRLAPHLPGEH